MEIRNQQPQQGYNLRPDLRPDINGRVDPRADEEDMDWKGTLLDRSAQQRRRPMSSQMPEPKNRLWIAAVAFGIVALVIVVTMMVKAGGADGNVQLIKADVTPYKTRPDQPGGTNVPFQDKLVFNRLDPNGQPVQAEKLLPPAEEPLTTKQVTAPPVDNVAPTPAAAPTTAVQAAPIVVKPAVTPEPVKETPVAEAPTPKAVPMQTVTQTPVAAAPTPAPVVKPEVVKPTPVAKVETPKAAMTTVAPAAPGSVRIQLASIPEAGNAPKALADLQAKYRSSLGGTSLGVVKADLPGKGTFYRIQSGGIDRASADRICAGIKAQGGACIIAH